jgi:hypothetical protein
MPTGLPEPIGPMPAGWPVQVREWSPHEGPRPIRLLPTLRPALPSANSLGGKRVRAKMMTRMGRFKMR